MGNASQSEARIRYWRDQVEAWKYSGQSQRAFCRAHELDYYRFGHWKKKFRRQAPEKSAPPPASSFISVVPATRSATDALSVTLTNGAVVNGITKKNLETVCLLLTRLS